MIELDIKRVSAGTTYPDGKELIYHRFENRL